MICLSNQLFCQLVVVLISWCPSKPLILQVKLQSKDTLGPKTLSSLQRSLLAPNINCFFFYKNVFFIELSVIKGFSMYVLFIFVSDSTSWGNNKVQHDMWRPRNKQNRVSLLSPKLTVFLALRMIFQRPNTSCCGNNNAHKHSRHAPWSCLHKPCLECVLRCTRGT